MRKAIRDGFKLHQKVHLNLAIGCLINAICVNVDKINNDGMRTANALKIDLHRRAFVCVYVFIIVVYYSN